MDLFPIRCVECVGPHIDSISCLAHNIHKTNAQGNIPLNFLFIVLGGCGNMLHIKLPMSIVNYNKSQLLSHYYFSDNVVLNNIIYKHINKALHQQDACVCMCIYCESECNPQETQ